LCDRTLPLAPPPPPPPPQLQALTRLAILRRGTPMEFEARGALQVVYDGLTEGFDLPHLVAARQALET
jgi:hypothetical protein